MKSAITGALAGVLDASTTLLLEPGRFLSAGAGVLLTRVLWPKRVAFRTFVVVDASMTELIRPALYEAYHPIEPVGAPRAERETVDVVGPVCESGDFLALDRDMPALAPGDLLAVQMAGAYGYVMSSNYNERPRPPEVLVDGARFAVVRPREDLAGALARESIPEWA